MTKEQSQLLKEFTAINSSFVLRDDIIAVLSADKSTSVFYKPADFTEFGTPARIWDVNEFLNILDVMGIDSSLEINPQMVVIKNNNKKINYILAKETTVPDVPVAIESKFEALNADYNFTLNKTDLEQIKRISSLLGLDEVKFTAEGSNVIVELGMKDNDSSNNFKLVLEGTGGENPVMISVESIMKLRNDSYKIVSSYAGISRFESISIQDLRYYLAHQA